MVRLGAGAVLGFLLGSLEFPCLALNPVHVWMGFSLGSVWIPVVALLHCWDGAVMATISGFENLTLGSSHKNLVSWFGVRGPVPVPLAKGLGVWFVFPVSGLSGLDAG